jgi:cysteine desulfurase
MQIYLDYNATAPITPAARAAVVAGLDLCNASSVHGFGRAARTAVTNARNVLSDYLAVKPAQIVFTSGATEAIVTAIRGVPAKTIMVGAAEHEAVRNTARAMPEHMVLPVDANGMIDLPAWENILKQSNAPALIAIQYVNNETGVIQPVHDILQLAKKYNAMTLIDAVQALGKLDLSDIRGADMIALSAHKMGGAKGAGALVLREGLSIAPLLTGGGQEERRRAGTENIAAIMGFGAAITDIQTSINKQNDLAKWRDAMEQEIAAMLPQVKIFNGGMRVANTSMLALPDAAATTQLMNLDLAGVAVSSGSACSSGKVTASHTLLAMGVPENIAASAVRISSGWNSSKEDYQDFTRIYIDMAKRFA